MALNTCPEINQTQTVTVNSTYQVCINIHITFDRLLPGETTTGNQNSDHNSIAQIIIGINVANQLLAYSIADQVCFAID